MVLLLFWTSPVFAQEQEPPFPKYAVGVYSGGIFFSDLTAGGETRADLSQEPPAGQGRSIAEADVFFDKETRFAAVGGIGLDILPNTPTKQFGAFIRMELVDH
jgi:hypothetical protein